jgi:polyphosphate kinase 2 (PPK2 family)
VDERKLRPAYPEAYADALSRCSTGYAPWYVVPADRKWYRDWAVAALLREVLVGMTCATRRPASMSRPSAAA